METQAKKKVTADQVAIHCNDCLWWFTEIWII